jgi:hypothetical protein
MRLVLGSVAGVLSLALAACDLGGGGSSNPAPTPTPTPTATPTPTPPTAITYTTSESGLQYTLEGGVQRVANAAAVAPAMGAVFAFTPAQNGYTYTLLNGSVNPTPSEAAIFTPASTKPCDLPTLCLGNGFVFQQTLVGAGSYYLSRFLAGPGNPLMVLSNTAFGLFEEAFSDAGGGPRQHVDLRPFAYGVTSPAGAIPATGSATFNGLVVGQATGNKPGASGTSNIYKVTGTSTLVVDYAARTATLKLTLAGDATGCGTPTTAPCSPDINAVYDSTAGTLASGVLTFALPGGGTAKFFLAGGVAADPATTPATVAVAPIEAAGSFSLTAADPNEAGVTMVIAGAGSGLR